MLPKEYVPPLTYLKDQNDTNKKMLTGLLCLYLVQLVGGACQPCNPGHYCLQTTPLSSCVPCPSGRYSFWNHSGPCLACTGNECPPLKLCKSGNYFNTNLGKCVACPIGTYIDYTLSTQCLTCPPGKFTLTSGNQECLGRLCPTGQYGNQNSASCHPCPRGSYNHQTGQPTCKTCAPGYYANQKGSILCVKSRCNSTHPFLSKQSRGDSLPKCLSCTQESTIVYTVTYCKVYLALLLMYHLWATIQYGICQGCAHLCLPGSSCFTTDTGPEIITTEPQRCVMGLTHCLNLCLWRGLSFLIAVSYLLVTTYFCAFSKYLFFPLLFFTFINGSTTLCEVYHYYTFNKIHPEQ